MVEAMKRLRAVLKEMMQQEAAKRMDRKRRAGMQTRTKGVARTKAKR
jgi:hypothetical protein